MMQMISLARRVIHLRALAPLSLGCAITACRSADLVTTTAELPAKAAEPALSSGFQGGIPYGPWTLPTEEFGKVYTGSMRNIRPKELRNELAAIKARGGRVVLMFAGNERHYKDGNGHFSLSMWKARVDAYRSVDFTSFIQDGTIIGHYLIDEPNDPFNWNGIPVSGAVVETMAEYSKRLWPTMPTIVRAEPGYLGKTGGPYRYLDAAWAQYVVRKGAPEDYIRRNVADAQKIGLALVSGLNIRKGAADGGGMSGSLVKSAGATILANGYSCAFLSWEYDKYYLARAGVREAMEALSPIARAHPARSCRSGSQAPPPPPPVQEEPVNQPPSAAFKVPVCTAAVPCRFSDRSTDTDGNITGRNWVLGNGTESSESSPSITYARVGTYDVTLTVTDDAGASSSVTRQVRVARGTLPNTEPIQLSATTYVQSNRQYVSLSWANMNGDMVAVYWNGNLREHTRNDRKLIRSYATRGPRIFTYRLCETGTSRCSNTVTASIN